MDCSDHGLSLRKERLARKYVGSRNYWEGHAVGGRAYKMNIEVARSLLQSSGGEHGEELASRAHID
jgi:hypothetical protein